MPVGESVEQAVVYCQGREYPHINSPPAWATISEAGERVGIVQPDEYTVSQKVVTRIVVIRRVLHMAEARPVPQSVPALNARPVASEVDDHVVVGCLRDSVDAGTLLVRGVLRAGGHIRRLFRV